MKRNLTIAVLVLAFGLQTAYADILPPGQRAIDVCAYFTNTASVLDTMAVIGFETAPDGSRVDLSSFIADECFKPGYKFNTYRVFGMAADHVKVIDSPTYEPAADMDAYPTNIELNFGTQYVSERSSVDHIKNAYKIIKLDTVKKQLIIEAVQSEEYYVGSDTPAITPLNADGSSKTAAGGEKVFTDVDSSSPYATALKYLKDNNVISGYDDGSFKPGNTINRAEFTKIVVGAALSPTADDMTNCEAHFASQNSYMLSIFKDVEFAMVGGNMPPWYLDYVCLAKLNNYISGYPDGTFKPEQNINFVEASKIVALAMNFKTDVTDPWYKTYVETLSNKKAIPLTIRSFNQNITRGEMAEMMYRLKAKVETLDSATYADIAF